MMIFINVYKIFNDFWDYFLSICNNLYVHNERCVITFLRDYVIIKRR